jgi:hypothetical protein
MTTYEEVTMVLVNAGYLSDADVDAGDDAGDDDSDGS